MTPTIKLGETVRDTCTGFKGHVMARLENISGRVQFEVQPPVNEDGKIPDSYWFDTTRLEVMPKTTPTE